MNFVLQTPSLQHLAQVKIVASLWNQLDVWTLIAESIISCSGPVDTDEEAEKWKEIEDQVTAKLPALPLPQSYKTMLRNFIKPLGMEILTWCKNHSMVSDDLSKFVDCLPKHFRWTFLGTVDYKQTAQLLVKEEKLDIVKRYNLACVNCLEEEIRRLIHLLPQNGKNEMDNMHISRLNGKVYLRDLIVIWTYIASGETSQLDAFMRLIGWQGYSPYQYAFHCVICYSGNRAACEYYFEKLSQKEKEQTLRECIPPPFSHLDEGLVVFHLLSGMGEKQRETLLEGCIVVVLECLLCWPCQSLFMETAKRWWRSISMNDYFRLLRGINDKILDGYKDYDYCELFREMWLLSSVEYKTHVVDNRYFANQLFNSKKELEIIRLILKETPSYQMEALVASSNRELRRILMDESVVSEETVIEWKIKVELDCVNEPDDEKRSKCDQLLRLVGDVMRRRSQKRKMVTK